MFILILYVNQTSTNHKMSMAQSIKYSSDLELNECLRCVLTYSLWSVSSILKSKLSILDESLSAKLL